MTPHTLRRTFASILAACDVPPRRAMYLMGHTDATLTLAIYQQVLDMGKGSVELLEQTLGCTLTEARAIYNGETTVAEVLGTSSEPTGAGPRGRDRSKARVSKNGRAGRQVSGTNPEPSTGNASHGRRRAATEQQKTRLSGALTRAAEGARTLDLLHGNCAADALNPMDTGNPLFPQGFHGPGIGFEW
jgi:Phage integrase family